MDGNIASAGHFVAAVLEHSGMLTQARVLEDFKDFFRDAGALVYFIAAIGGLISLVMFGSFRSAKYLIIGPALYWFLVGPTMEIEGVVAKLGGGQPRGLPGVSGSAEGDRDKVIEKSGQTASGNIKVSRAFWLFAKPIDDFVEEFVDVMLKDEDGSDLAVGSKVRALEMIARALPQDTELINLLEGEILANCLNTYSSAMGAAENYVKTSITEGISPRTAAKNRSYNQTVFDREKESFLKAAENTTFSIRSDTTPTLFELIKTEGKAGGQSKLLQEHYKNGRPVESTSCAKGWDIYLEQLWHLAGLQLPQIVRLASGEFQNKKEYEKACKDVTRKIYDDGAGGVGANQANDGDCDLRPGVALSLLWNHISRRDTFQRIGARHNNRNDPLNSVIKSATGVISSIPTAGKNLKGILFSPLVQTYANAIGGTVLSSAVGVLQSKGEGLYDATIEQAPAVGLQLLNGLSAASQVDLQVYETTRMRQQIFSFAQQLPYFQGIMLYVICFGYPFAALIVLLPGRAAGFLNVPLMWLWVKSWDIGFAAIILLEKVMYNLLPNWSVNRELRTQEPWTYDQLPLILGEGYNFSHVQGVAYHYVVLSMAMLSIPAVMALITVKSKKAILSSFVDAATDQARESGQRAASGYSITASNERSQMISELSGFAKLSPALSSGGLEGGTRGAASFGVAKIGMLTKAMSSSAGGLANLKDIKGSWDKIISTSEGTLKDGLTKYQNLVGANTTFESQYRAAFDPLFGRWGALQMHADAAAASLDGAGARVSGGFETNNARANAISAYGDLAKKRLDNMIGFSSNVGEAQGAAMNAAVRGLGNVPFSIADGDTSGIIANFTRLAVGTGVLADDLNDGNTLNQYAVNQILSDVRVGLERDTEGYSSLVSWSRMWGVSPEMFSDQAVVDIKAKINEDSGFSSLLMLGIYTHGNQLLKEEGYSSVAGGISGYDGILAGFGGDRTVIRGLSQSHVDSGINIYGELNSKSDFEQYQANIYGNRFAEMLGVENPGIVFQKMQIESELTQKQAQPDIYNERLNQAVGITGGFAIFEDIRGDSSEEKAREIVERAREIEKEDNERGFNLHLPFGMEQLVEKAPVSALEVINRWEIQRESAAIGSSLEIQSGSTNDTLVSPDQLRLRRK